MKITLYIYKYTNEKLVVKDFFSKYRLEQLEISSNETFVNRAIETEYILYYLLNKHFGFKKLDFKVTPQGRPLLKGDNQHFSISHSKDYLVIAISNDNLAVDIEYVNESKISIKKRLYPKINNYTIDQVIKDFTIKESFIKYQNSSVTTNLKSINISETEVYNQKLKLNYQSFNFMNEYYIAVVAQEQFQLTVREVNDIINLLK